MPALLFDWVLALTMVWVAHRALRPGELFRSIVLFIVLGLLTALGWVRLGAVDVALAEAAIGSGLTGALLVDAAASLARQRRKGFGETGADL